jgi:hypothetical protein
MDNKLVKPNGNGDLSALLEEFKVDQFPAIKKLNEYLNKEPKKEWVQVNKHSENAKYLPIRIVENLLRSFFGVYQVEMVGQPHIIGNSVVVSVHLKVYHPILKEWLIYAGVGAVPIQLEQGANPLEFDRIKSKALHKNVPAAKSFAVSNAAKSIGRIFGSDLNNDEISTVYNVYQV